MDDILSERRLRWLECNTNGSPAHDYCNNNQAYFFSSFLAQPVVKPAASLQQV